MDSGDPPTAVDEKPTSVGELKEPTDLLKDKESGDPPVAADEKPKPTEFLKDMESGDPPTAVDEKPTSVGESKKPTKFLKDMMESLLPLLGAAAAGDLKELKEKMSEPGATKRVILVFFFFIACLYALTSFFEYTGIILVVFATLVILKAVKTVKEAGFHNFFIKHYHAHKNGVPVDEEVEPLIEKIFYSALAYYAICVLWRVFFVAERVTYWGKSDYGWPHNYELVSMLIILSMLICCYKAMKDSTNKKWLYVYGIAHAVCLALTAPLIPYYGYAAFYAATSECYDFCYRPATFTYNENVIALPHDCPGKDYDLSLSCDYLDWCDCERTEKEMNEDKEQAVKDCPDLEHDQSSSCKYLCWCSEKSDSEEKTDEESSGESDSEGSGDEDMQEAVKDCPELAHDQSYSCYYLCWCSEKSDSEGSTDPEGESDSEGSGDEDMQEAVKDCPELAHDQSYSCYYLCWCSEKSDSAGSTDPEGESDSEGSGEDSLTDTTTTTTTTIDPNCLFGINDQSYSCNYLGSCQCEEPTPDSEEGKCIAKAKDKASDLGQCCLSGSCSENKMVAALIIVILLPLSCRAMLMNMRTIKSCMELKRKLDEGVVVEARTSKKPNGVIVPSSAVVPIPPMSPVDQNLSAADMSAP